MKAQNIRVVKNEEKPETPEVLAASLIRISDGFEKLLKQGLTTEAIVSLLHNMRGMQEVGRPAIRLVLENLPRLKSYYIRK